MIHHPAGSFSHGLGGVDMDNSKGTSSSAAFFAKTVAGHAVHAALFSPVEVLPQQFGLSPSGEGRPVVFTSSAHVHSKTAHVSSPTVLGTRGIESEGDGAHEMHVGGNQIGNIDGNTHPKSMNPSRSLRDPRTFDRTFQDA